MTVVNKKTKNNKRNKRNKRNKCNKCNKRNKSQTNTLKHLCSNFTVDNKADKLINSIENTTREINAKLVNKNITTPISSLRAMNNQYNVQSIEVGQGLRTKCFACRQRLFGPT